MKESLLSMKDFLLANKGASSLILVLFLNIFISIAVLFRVRVENLVLFNNYSIEDEVCEIKAIQAVKKAFEKQDQEVIETDCYVIEMSENQAKLQLENGVLIEIVYDDVFRCFESVEYSQWVYPY